MLLGKGSPFVLICYERPMTRPFWEFCRDHEEGCKNCLCKRDRALNVNTQNDGIRTKYNTVQIGGGFNVLLFNEKVLCA